MTLLLEGVNRDTHFAGLLVNSLTLGGQEVPHSLYTLAMKVRGCSCVHLSIDMRAKGTVCCAGACRSAPGLNTSNQCCEGHHFCASCLQMQQVLNASSSICDCMEQQLLVRAWLQLPLCCFWRARPYMLSCLLLLQTGFFSEQLLLMPCCCMMMKHRIRFSLSHH